MGKSWTDEEVSTLRANPEMSVSDLQVLLPDRSRNAISNTKLSLGIKYKRNPKAYIVCEICGIQKEVQYSRKDTQRFCSKDCFGKSQVGESHHAWNGGPNTDKVCEECGTTFTSWENDKRRLCSKECARLQMTGSGNPSWKGGVVKGTREGRDYFKWRHNVYERDQYTCQCCQEVGGSLNAHHIASYARYPELRTTLDNGITLCESCHKEFHKLYGTLKFTPDDTFEYLKNKENSFEDD